MYYVRIKDYIFTMSSILRVWSFAAELTDEDKEQLLKYFGATSVQHVSRNNQNIAALARFKTHEDCEYALQKLHQQTVLGKRLLAAYHDSQKPPESQQPHRLKKDDKDIKETSQKEKIRRKIQEYEAKLCGVSSTLGADYPISPHLRYLYPPPSPSVIANIAHTLAAVPKFYTQVLHLMNKMNLPTPFGQVGKVSHHYAEALRLLGFSEEQNTNQKSESSEQPLKDKLLEDETLNEPEELSPQETESELESDEDAAPRLQDRPTQPIKRKLKPKNPINKKPKLAQLHQTIVSHPRSSEPSSITDVFEPASKGRKKLKVCLPETLLQHTADTEPVSEPGGFGIIEAPQEHISQVPEDPAEWEREASKYITKKELEDNRVSQTDWPLLPVFKNYNAGEPSTKLYIKNLAKTTTEDDLKYIYGRYIFWQNEEETELFTIRLMKEGRMKGQAFVTFPNTQQATDALGDTNGFILKDKPMVVVFGRVNTK